MISQFGNRIRILREEQNFLLRELAPLLDMDTAQLSKIERGGRNAKKETVLLLASIFKVAQEELLTLWLADQIYEVIKNENTALQAMQVVEETVKQSKNLIKVQNSLKLNIKKEPEYTNVESIVIEKEKITFLKDNDYFHEKANIQKLDFFLNHINVELNKVKYVDACIDKGDYSRRLLKYYNYKLSNSLVSNTVKRNNFEFIDLFCGAGGLSTGLEHAGFIPSLAVDKDKSSLQTYHFNRPFLNSAQIINDDIRKVIKDFEFENKPLLVGGPPCQGFSNANKQKKEDDDRNELYKFYLHAVASSNSDIFLLENVEGILKFYQQIQSDFSEINYTLFSYKLNTKDFGFPQNRKRVFILGIKNKHAKLHSDLNKIFNDVISANMNKVNFSLWDAISDLPEISAKTKRNSSEIESDDWGYTFGEFKIHDSEYSNFINGSKNIFSPLLNHKSKFNNQRDIEIYRLLTPGEGSNAKSIESINPYLNRENIFKDKFYKLRPDEPSKTITAHMYYDCHMYIHPYQSRGLTPREAARIQGFPDDYLFLGSPNEWYRQIGNAVSPLLARVLGKALNKVLNRIYEF
jgi:DNA (cytosine-5)-methyltransferase 1